MTRLVIVGDALLDRDVEGPASRLSPEAPVPVVDATNEQARPGGAGLVAALAARDGCDVTLVTALAPDESGEALRSLLHEAGVRVVDIGLKGTTPEKIRVLAGGQPVVRVDRGSDRGELGPFHSDAHAALYASDAVVVADYGRGVTAKAAGALSALVGERPVVWDPHMNGSAPVAGTRLVTPNERELFATMNSQATRPGLRAVAEAARDAARRWHVHAVAVTLGHRGALLAQGYEPPFVVPAMPVRMGDTCGAGDCFAGAAAAALGRGALVSEAVERAVACATSFVAAGGARVHRPTAARPQATIEPANASRAIDVTTAVRARGGVVVATGGCFDLLHTGHIATLERARRLGDCLIVLVNSDESVRRLKGPGRPLRPARERAAVLQALGCVDAVEIFDADTPSDALERLRPDVFAKGGDYTLDNLPEAHVLARWGGQAVVLPYVPGRSTTALVEKARTPLAQPNSPVH